MRKFFVVLVWVMGLGLAALFTKDIVRGVRNVIAINHFTPTEVNNAPIGWHQDLCCYQSNTLRTNYFQRKRSTFSL